jgi:YYY domain-containing protein
MRTQERGTVAVWARFKAFAWRVVLLVGLTVLLYLPYIRHFAAGYTALDVWSGSRTPFNIYLWIYGMLLFPLVTRLLIELWRLLIPRGDVQTVKEKLARRQRWLGLVVGLGVVVGAALVLAGLGYEVALVVLPVGVGAAILALAPGTPSSRRFLWLMVGAGLALTLVVEMVVLRGDISRMNTVFKFYLQVWILLAISTAVSMAWVYQRARTWLPEGRALWCGVMVALILGGALFLPFGVRARAIDRMAPEAGLTLDGMAFMEYGFVSDGAPDRGAQPIPLRSDYAAIRWMQDHVEGSPVVLEGLGYREYLWGNRVSIYTGLPTVIGWRWHQQQQRVALPEPMVDWRQMDVRACYDTPDVSLAQEILDRYDVRYVYVGAYERAYYDPAGLAKFDRMAEKGLLRVVYDADGVRIYEVSD